MLAACHISQSRGGHKTLSQLAVIRAMADKDFMNRRRNDDGSLKTE
jgi:hypothetical protein